MTEWLHFHFSLSCIGESNGNPLQYSCLENPRDRGAWWAAVCGVAQSRTWLKRLSSSSSIISWLEGFPFPEELCHNWFLLWNPLWCKDTLERKEYSFFEYSMVETQDSLSPIRMFWGSPFSKIRSTHSHCPWASIIVQKICTTWELPVHKSIYIPCQGSFILPPERNRTSFLVWIWIEILLTLSSLLMKESWVTFASSPPVNAAWKSLMQHSVQVRV